MRGLRAVVRARVDEHAGNTKIARELDVAPAVAEDDAARNDRYAVIARSLAEALRDMPSLTVRTIADLGHGGLPLVQVVVSPGANQPNASQIAARLRTGKHSIHVDSTNADQGILMLVPTCLEIGDAAVIGTAFAAALAGGA